MTYSFTRRYRGPVRAVVFDLAGTIVDYGSRAPTDAFIELFRRHSVAVSPAEVRRSMGSNKREHLIELLRQEGVAQRWEQVHGAPPASAAIDELYDQFLPLQVKMIEAHHHLIAGAADTVRALRSREIGIATTTGYPQEVIGPLLAHLRAQGLVPDASVCSSDVQAGRPAPWMLLEAMRRLGVYPPAATVKVDDTVSGIEAGLNACAWTVGVALTGNEVGRSPEEIASMSVEDRNQEVNTARSTLEKAGAHFVVDSVADLVDTIDAIERRLRRGDMPG